MAQKKYSYDHLDKKTIDFIKKELNENPAQVHAHIESFRRWFASMPHLNAPTDDASLLRFLRVSKFDHSKAQKRFDNYITTRASPRGFPSWFKYPTMDDPIVDKVLDIRQMTPLGYNELNEMVLLIRPQLWNPDLVSMEKLCVIMFMGMDILLNDERTQIFGVTMVVDLEHVGRKQMEAWGNPTNLKKFSKIWQDSYPMRKKNTFFYKEPMLFDIIFKMMEFWQSEKIRQRNIRLKDDFKKIFDKMPGGKAIMPKEYGGDGGTLDEIAERWKKTFKEYYSQGDPLNCITVDESKRPESTLKFMTQFADYPGGDPFGMKGTYVKLDV